VTSPPISTGVAVDRLLEALAQLIVRDGVEPFTRGCITSATVASNMQMLELAAVHVALGELAVSVAEDHQRKDASHG
jgi:hypothetical protein